MAGREVIFEFDRIGNPVKATALDPVNLVEVSVVGPAGAGEEALRRAALRKLDRALDRRGAGGRSAGRLSSATPEEHG
ncbi:MAG: DUF6898 family protein [Pseudomonadota bacterium]